MLSFQKIKIKMNKTNCATGIETRAGKTEQISYINNNNSSQAQISIVIWHIN